MIRQLALIVGVIAVVAPGLVPGLSLGAARAQPETLAQALAAPAVAPAAAPAGETPTLSPDQLHALAGSLDDPAQRAKLIAQLDALAAGQKALQPAVPAAPPPSSVLSRFLEQLSQGVAALGDNLTETAGAVQELPRLEVWASAQVESPALRQRWITLAWQTGLAMAAGLTAARLVDFLLRRPRHALEAGHHDSWLMRFLVVLGRTLLELLPIIAFTTIAYLLLPILQPTRIVRLIALAVINANVLVQGVLAVGRLALSPHPGATRLFRLSDETANYAYLWLRRLVGVTVYGFVAIEAGLTIGMPAGAHDVLQRIFGLILVTLLVILVLQNRAGIAAWLKSGDGAAAGAASQRWRLARRRFAEIWHVLAILYIVAVYLVWALEIPHGFQYLVRGTGWTLAILIAARLATLLIRRTIGRGFRVSDELRERLPGLEPRINRYMPIFDAMLRLVVALIALGFLLQAWGVGAFDWVSSNSGRKIVGGALAILVVLALAAAVWEVTTALMEHYMAARDANGVVLPRSARARTLLPLARNALGILLFVFIALEILSQVGVNIAPLLAGAGVIGLAIGFGAQTLVKDVITGLFILIEDTISVGDIVNVDNKGGVVEGISIRTIKLRDTNGALHTVPFSAVNSVTNLTKNFAYYVFNVGVDYAQDTDRVIAVLTEIDVELRQEEPFKSYILAPLEVWGVDQFGDNAVTIIVRSKTQPVRQWAVGREFNRRMKKRFDAAGIAFPFPQRDLHIQLPEALAASLRAASGAGTPGAGAPGAGAQGAGAQGAGAEGAAPPSLPDPTPIS